MAKKVLVLLLSLACVLVPLFALPAAAESKPLVYIVPVRGEIETGLYNFLKRSFAEAEENQADAIILEINTNGGFVNAAEKISTLIQNSPIPVYAYVRRSAISAGAFIALSCRALYMAPGSAIGAAEVIDLTGQEVSEKTVSSWEGKMRSVAEQQGKDPEIAAAMVRASINIPDLSKAGELLTLTTAEAEQIGFTDGVFASYEELLPALGLAGAQEIVAQEAWAERLARFVTRPYIAVLLVTIGLAALVIEVLTAGFGVAGVISILAFAFFFGGHIAACFAGKEVLFLFVIGIVLLLIEAIIPSFGIIGIGGIVAVVASIVLSAATTGQGLRILLSSIILTVLIVVIAYRFLRKSPLWSQIVLQYAETKERGYVGVSDYSHLVGKVGSTLTALRPAGVAEFDGERFDVVSEGAFIKKAEKVKVIKVEGSRIVVRLHEN